MKPNCALILCDASYRIFWLTECPGGHEYAKVIGKWPWEFLRPEDAERFQAALTRVNLGSEREQVDFTVPSEGLWRAWLHPCPHPVVRLAILARRTPVDVLALTASDRLLCRLLAEGLCSKQIAARLEICRKTVDSRRAKIAERIGRHPRCLVAWCGEFREWL